VSSGEWLWENGSGLARLSRAALWPAAQGFRAVVALRNWCYDAGVFPEHAAAIPAISIGNVSVGGTGKTPVAAWIVARLVGMGATPAIVMRGYRGGDEIMVHRELNPGTTVLECADRVRGVEQAQASGCDVAVLDDAFQHRRIARVADVVLVSAERYTAAPQLLPAGGWREPLTSLRRASLVIVVRKSAPEERCLSIARELAVAFGRPVATVALSTGDVIANDGTREPAASLSGQRVMMVTGIGDPASFEQQLRALGASVTRSVFDDHHRYTPDDVAGILRRATGHDAVVCTLKDAVKLRPLWPRDAAPMRYVSQRVSLEYGAETLEYVLQRALKARHPNSSPIRQAASPIAHAD